MTKEIIDQLKKYLTKVQCIELELSLALPGSITICMTITSIINEYDCTDEEEQIVSGLLSRLCKLHFDVKSELLK